MIEKFTFTFTTKQLKSLIYCLNLSMSIMQDGGDFIIGRDIERILNKIKKQIGEERCNEIVEGKNYLSPKEGI